MSRMEIPFALPYLDDEEVEAVGEVIRSNWVSQGSRVKDFESALSEYVGARFGIATNSCTSALHLSLLLSGIMPGDEVICPSFTCMATANAIHHVGAAPVFVEIDPRTFNLDPAYVKDAITPRTRGIMAVHQIGLSAEMDELVRIADEHDLVIVEDAATALGGEYKGKRIGSLGSPTCFSFHPRKVITSGEGGMITTDDEAFAEKARIVRAHGASISDLDRHFAKGTIYAAYPVVGYNYRMTDMQGVMGVIQMKKLPFILQRRHEICQTYDRLLKDIDEVETPYVPEEMVHSYQSYLIRFKPEYRIDRDGMIRQMAERGIACRHGIAPLHKEPYYLDRLGKMHLPITEQVSRETMFLPLYPTMNEDEIDYVVSNLKDLIPVSR
jgi:perosamine synthetase